MDFGHWLSLAGLAMGGTGLASILVFAGRAIERMERMESAAIDRMDRLERAQADQSERLERTIDRSVKELTTAISELRAKDHEVVQRIASVEARL